MRIVIDMQGAQTESRVRGIGRYTIGFAQGIVRNRGEHDVILVLSSLFPETIQPIRKAFDSLLPKENIRILHMPGPVREGHSGNNARREIAELIREAFLASLYPDVIHICSLFEGYVDDAVTSIGRFDTNTHVSVTIYDLIPLLNQDQYLKPNPTYEKYYLRKIEHLKKASQYVSISKSSQQEGIQELGRPASLFVNAFVGVEEYFKPEAVNKVVAAQLRKKFDLHGQFLLYTGGADERKNLPRLIEAFAALPIKLRKHYQLVLAGKISDGELLLLKQVIQHAGLELDEVRLTGYIKDEELVQLYNLCQLYIFPSWHEGFGLPALEAMACGAPVIGAATSSLPEVIGYKEALFDPFDVYDMSKKIEQALEDDVYRKQLREHGLQQAKKFSWDQTSTRTIKAWKKIVPQRMVEDVNSPEKNEYFQLYRNLINRIAPVLEGAKNSDLEALAKCLASNEQEILSFKRLVGWTPSWRKKLLVDVSELYRRDARTGIQRVVRCVLNELLHQPPEGYDICPVYGDKVEGFRYTKKFKPEATGFRDGQPVQVGLGDVFLGLDLCAHLFPEAKLQMQAFRLAGAHVYYVVYDIIPLRHAQFTVPGTYEAFNIWLSSLARCADGLVCISSAVAKDVAVWLYEQDLDSSLPMIRHFRLGADIDLSMGVDGRGISVYASQVLTGLQMCPSFLSVSTIEPRKAQAQTLAAFESLWAQGVDINLVLVGKQGWMVEQLVGRIRAHPERDKRLFWLEGVSDEYLVKLYAASSCLIAPSEAEGFGLPLIEAAQHKLPIIARDIPVFREVAGEHAFYFENSKDPQCIAEAVMQWLELNARGKAPRSDDMPWLTWAQSAQQLMDIVLEENTSNQV